MNSLQTAGDDPETDQALSPKIELTQAAVASNAGLWQVSWRIENRGGDSLGISAARLPHGQFKAEELRFDPALVLAAGERNTFQTWVRCNEPPGLVTENAFIILNANWLGQPWRIFVRLRVIVNCDGKPETETESITTQKVGFSGVDS
jgi:hypothetical protein